MKTHPSRIVILLVWAAILVTLLIAGSEPVSGQSSKQVQSVGTLGDLKARRPVVREVIEVRNGSATNLWAAPRTFVHDPDATDAADDVYVVTNAAASGRYTATDRSTGIIDPRHFGAIPDDLYDDSTPMLAAFAAAGTRASVYIPQGRFIITQPLPLLDRLHVHGEGDGSMIAVANTNGVAFWNPTPGTRVYEVFLEKFAINTALGARGYTAITLTNVSYARLEKLTIHAYDGKGFQIGVKPWGDSPASVGGAWSSSMVGCRIYVYPRPGQPAYAFYGSGGPEWGHGPNSWRIIDNYLNCQPESVFLDGGTNNGTAVLFAQNQNGIQISKNIFEGSYTNSVILDTGAASTIDGNRFEVSYGIGGTNFAAIRMNNMTNVFIAGNMSQGLGDYTKYIRASSNSSYSVFDAASGSPNTIDGDLLIGRSWSVDDTGYLPYVTNYAIVGSKRNPEKLGMGLRTIDGTVNPRAIMTLNAEPGATDSWAGIFHGSSLATVPFYFYASRTNLAITDSGIGVLGLPTVSSALSAYGNAAFGSDPSVAGGWTDMNEGVWVRTTDLADRAGFHAIVNDGVTNRRIEMMVSKTNAAIRTTATTDNLPLDFWVAGKNPLSLDEASVKIRTNMQFLGASSITIGGDTIDDFTGSGLSVVSGKLTATGSGSGDVVGPASSTDSVVALYDGTTGKLLKNGTLTEAAINAHLTEAEASALFATVYQEDDADLAAYAALSTAGLVARTGAGTVATRTLTGDSEIAVANGDGVAGNPTLSIGAAIARVAAIAAAYQPLDDDLTDLSDGTLTGSKLGAGINDDNVDFDDADGLWTATTLGAALEELNDSINAGAPNGTGAKVHWSQLLGVPAGFADGTDDGSGGGGNADTNAANAWGALQTFNGGIDAPGTNNLGVIHVTGIESDTPIDQSIGGTGGIDPQSARAALGLAYDTDVLAFYLSLKQIAQSMLADGDMPYRNAAGVMTNTPSLAFGRSVLNTLDAAAVRALVGAVYGAGDTMSGPLLVPYIASVSGHTNVGSNHVATLRALAEVEARVSVGGFISSVTSDFEVDGGELRFTNTVGTGAVLRESAAGTNAQLAGLSDVTVSTPVAGQTLVYDGAKWVNGELSRMELSSRWVEHFTGIFGGAANEAIALDEWTSTTISGGTKALAGTYAGRNGVWQANGAPAAISGGAAIYNNGSTIVPTNTLQFKVDVILVLTNDLMVKAAYNDTGTSTNLATDSCHLVLTNGMLVGEATQGGFANRTQTSTAFQCSSNVWYTWWAYATNGTAWFRVFTNQTQLAWEDSVASNVPNNTQLMGVGITAISSGSTSTNKMLVGVDMIGHRYSVQ